MKWVTRDYVHLDRVASPWLITRFVDPQAEFVFVPWGAEDQRAADAIPLALPGAELGPHDASGTTFEKIAAKYQVDDPAIAHMARIIRKGVDWVLHGFKPEPDDVDGQIAVGLVSLAEGILLVRQSDTAVLTESYFVYDALYAHLRADALVASQQLELPSLKGGPGARVRFLREVWNSDQSAANAGAPSTR